ncbi:MAG: hypothetical protein MZU95_10490 [Desulfomicrobium escambiense]|nr:hypothetical protein [Desulfomicrobium escambiense]
MLGIAGIDATLDLAAPDGARVQSLRYADTGAEVGAADVIAAAGCVRPSDPADVLCANSGFSNVVALTNPATGNAWTAVDFLIDSLMRDGVPAPRHSLDDVNATAVWPAAPFVQPLIGVGPYFPAPVTTDGRDRRTGGGPEQPG